MGPDILTRRVVQPDTGLLDHARGLGIHLKSSRAMAASSQKRALSPNSLPARQLSARTLMSGRSKSSGVRFTPQHSQVQYIHNVVVPINAPTDDQNVQRSVTPHSFSSSRTPGSSLPRMRRSVPSSAKTFSTFSSYSDKYTTTSSVAPTERSNYSKQSCPTPRRKKSEQELRYENKEDNLYKARTLMRTAEIRPHRVDRMYYMCGSVLGINARYDVDEEELQHLRDLVKSRRSSKHYGRGLSKYKFWGLSNQTHLPPVTEPKLKSFDRDAVKAKWKLLAARALLKQIIIAMKRAHGIIEEEETPITPQEEKIQLGLEHKVPTQYLNQHLTINWETARTLGCRLPPIHIQQTADVGKVSDQDVAYRLPNSLHRPEKRSSSPHRFYAQESAKCDCRSLGNADILLECCASEFSKSEC